ncbi:MAG: hypothetical protein IKQ97_05085 [Eubacterium sp.]|nr:hypothetical protein [Eubacterium sp.]
MISERIELTSKDKRIPDILKVTEDFVRLQSLDKKQALHMTLLAEELVGLISGITTDFRGEFWVEGSAGAYDVCIEAETLVNKKRRDELMAMSSSGKNIEIKGVMGRIRNIFEGFMLSYDETENQEVIMSQMTPYSAGGMVDMNAFRSMESQIWSLDEYRKNLVVPVKESEEGAVQAWDEMEKSVVAKLADDVRVGIRGSRVTMVIHKEFT